MLALTGDDAVAVVDLETLTEVGRLKTGRGPDGMAWLDKDAVRKPLKFALTEIVRAPGRLNGSQSAHSMEQQIRLPP